jgi:[ribosomal protein S18]-alanine N-acetyltransferase
MPIRRATPEDIPALISLERRAATAAHWTAEQYEAAFANGAPSSRLFLVLEKESAVQGFIVGRAIGEEWEIENIAVAEPIRSRGLGTRLLGEILDLARGRGAQAVFLEVRESNLAARRLYEKWAFIENGRRGHYYRNPEEDAILYRLDFA